MRSFFDTEFLEDGKTIQLISIGVVREDGATYYAETEEALGLADSDPWLRANVLPHLRLTTDTLKRRDVIAREVREFAGPSPEWWAGWGAYDWVVLNQLYGRMVDHPDDWPYYCRDVIQWVEQMGVTLPPQEGNEHDALADACWVRDVWAALNRNPDVS